MRRLICCGLLALALSGCKMPSFPEFDLFDDIWPYGGGTKPEDIAKYGPTPGMQAEALRRRGLAAARLSPAEQQAAVEELTRRIRAEPDPLIRLAIIESLAQCQVPLAAQVLRAGLQDESADIRVACCKIWGSRGGPEAVEILGAVIAKDANIDVRLAAVRALGGLREAGTVQALAVALEERQDPALQYAAVVSLKTATNRDLGNDLAAWRQFVAQPDAVPDRSQPSLADRFFRWH